MTDADAATSATLPNPKEFYEAEETTFMSFATMWLQP